MLPKIANSPEELNQILNKFKWNCIVKEEEDKYLIAKPDSILN